MADNFDNYGMKVQATASVKMPTASEIDKQIRNLEKSISKLQISGKLDDSSLKNLSHQLDTLKATVTTANFSPTALTELTNQVNRALQNINIGNINIGGVGNQAQQAGQQLGQQISQGVAQGINNNEQILNSFRNSLQRINSSNTTIAMDDSQIENVVQDVENLGLRLESVKESMSTINGRRGARNVLSVAITGVDELGQAVSLTRQYNTNTGELTRSVDSLSSATQKANTQLENLSAQQIKRQQDLRNQISQIYNSAIDPNASRSITDADNLDNLRTQYNDIQTAINNMGSTSKTVFAEQEANVTSLITTLKNSVSEYKNAENVSTSLKPDKLAEGISKAQSRWKALDADIKNACVSSEKLTQQTQLITEMLGRIDNGGVLNKAEVEQVHTALTNAKNELTALVKIDASNSSLETIRLQAETLKNKLDEFSKKNTGFADWTREVNNTTVSVETLKTELDNVKTASDLRVATARVNEFESAFKAANATVSKTNDLTEKINKIQLSTDITKIENDYKRFGIVSQEVENNLKELKIARENALKAEGTDKASVEIEKYNQKLAETKSSWKELQATQVSVNQRTSQMTEMQEWMRKNKNATKLCGDQVERLIKECQTCDKIRFDGIKNEFKELQVQAGKAGKLGNTLWGSIVEQGKSFIQWTGVSGLVMSVWHSFKQGATNVKKLDDSLVELSKVSDLSAQGLENITEEAFELGEQLSKTGTDVLDATTNFKRAGYDIEDSMKYAEEALKTTNISENLKDAGEAASSLVNIMKGFQDETPEFASKINDAVNQVSNTEAVDFDNLIDGATRLSAVADQAGMSFEQMLGTLTGGYEILGNMEKVATGQITIFSRLQAIQLEGEEEVSTVAKLQEKFSNATKGAVNIVDQTTGQLRNVYDILDDMANVWDSLDKNTREALAIEAAGIRQKNVFLALMQNWNGVEDAVESAKNSLGSADEENKKYLDSLSGRIENFESATQHLSKTLIDSDLLKFFVDLGTTGVKAIDGLVNALTPLGALTTIGAGILGGKGLGLTNYVTHHSLRVPFYKVA